MQVSLEITRDDFVDYIVFRSSKALSRKPKYWWMLIGMVISSALPVLILCTTKKPLLVAIVAIWPLWLVPIGVCAFFALVLFVMSPARLRGRAQTAVAAMESDSPEMFGNTEIRIDTDGITQTSKASSTTLRWSEITSVNLTERHAFISHSGGGSVILPRAGFTDAAAFDRFVDAIGTAANVVAASDTDRG